VRGVSVAAIVLILGVCLCGLAGAQTVKFQALTIEQAENGFVVKGTVRSSGLNDVGIVERDRMEVAVDIMGSAGAKYGLLPQSMYIRDPAGAETCYTKGSGPGGTMTKAEYYGTDVKSFRVAAFALRKEPVWRAYGGLKDWSKNAPDTVTSEFTGTIPLEHAGKTVRIRASLTHEWGGPYANWPAFSFHHDIGYEGVLKATGVNVDQPHEIKITWGPQSSANPAFPGQQVQCIVAAEDSLGHDLKYKWTALGAALGFNDPTLKSPTWTVQPNNTNAVVYWTIAVEVSCDHGASAKGHYVQKIQPSGEEDKAKALIMERFKKLPSGYFKGHSLFGVIPPGAANNLAQAFFDWGKYAPIFWPSFDAMEAQASKFEQFTCGSCQTKVLAMLDQMRLHGTAAEKEVFKYWDYGPIMSLGTWHQVVVIYPKGSSWRLEGTVLDPWPTQKPEAMTLGEWMKSSSLYVAPIPSFFWNGQYPLTGGKSYPTEPPPKPTPKQRRTARLLNSAQKQHYQSLQGNAARLNYLNQVGAQMEKANPNIFKSVATGTKSPVHMLITDSAGRRSGWVDANTFVNEIPAAEITDYDEPDNTKGMMALLPLATYQVKVTARQAGTFSLLRAMPEQFTTAALAHTAELNIAPGDTFTYTLSPDEPMTKLIKPGAAVIPFTDMVPGTGVGTGLQRLHPVADAYVYEYGYRNWNRANFGKLSTMTAGYHPQGGEKRVHMRFELPALGSVKRATLKLYQYHFAGQHVHRLCVHRVTGPWLEGNGVEHPGQSEPTAPPGEISWADQPGFDAAPAVTFMPPDNPNEWVEVDITALVNSWLAGAANYGLMLKVAALPTRNMPNTWYGFRSREYEDQAKHAVLELTLNGTTTGGTVAPPVGTNPPPNDDDDTDDLPPQLSDPVIRRAAVCEGVDEKHQPILRSSFPADTQRIGIYLEWANAAPNTQIRIQWYRDGKALWDSRMVAEGTRRAVSYLRSGESGTPLKSGRYQAQIFRGSTPVVALTFTIGLTR